MEELVWIVLIFNLAFLLTNSRLYDLLSLVAAQLVKFQLRISGWLQVHAALFLIVNAGRAKLQCLTSSLL